MDCPRFSISLYNGHAQPAPVFVLNDGSRQRVSLTPLTLDENWRLDDRIRRRSQHRRSRPIRPLCHLRGRAFRRRAVPLLGALCAHGRQRADDRAVRAQSYAEDAFGDADIALLGPVANQIGLAIKTHGCLTTWRPSATPSNAAERNAELSHC